MPAKRDISASGVGLAILTLFAFVMLAAGCERDKVQVEVEKPRDAGERVQWQSVFEGKAVVEWVSPSAGRFVVMRAFDRDTDASGDIEIRIGQHGEPEGDEPTLLLFDTRSETSIELDEIYPPGAHSWLAFTRDETVQLLRAGAGTFSEISNVDARDDSNACLGPRGLSLSDDGRAIAIIESGGASIRMGSTRDIENLDVVRFDEQVWRVRALSRDWALVHLADEFPRAKTTCVCAWCKGLASSVGNYGFEGEWSTRLVRRDGLKLTFEGGAPVPLSSQVVLDERVREGGLKRVETEIDTLEEAPALEVDARFVTGMVGVSNFVRRAADGELVLTDGIKAPRAVDPALRIVDQGIRAHLDAAFASHLLVRATRGRDQKFVSFDLESARVLDGPDSGRASSVHPTGWVLVAGRNRLAAFHLLTGVVQEIDQEGPVGVMDALAFESRGTWFVVDPQAGTVLETAGRPRFVTENGCFLRAKRARGRIEDGPFALVCASE